MARVAAHATLADLVASLGELVESLCGVHKKRVSDRSASVKINFSTTPTGTRESWCAETRKRTGNLPGRDRCDRIHCCRASDFRSAADVLAAVRQELFIRSLPISQDRRLAAVDRVSTLTYIL